MATVDLTIRGAGIFGLCIAWRAQQCGARVRVVDPNGVGAGASGGILGALAPHTPDRWNAKKQFQFESLMMAEAFWAEVDAISGLSSGYARRGRLQPLADDATVALAQDRAADAQTNWQGQAVWEVVGDARDDWGMLSPTGKFVRDTLSARIFPRMACASLARAILARGGEIVEEAGDQGQVVHATGVAGLEALSEGRTRVVGNGVKGQAARLQLDRAEAPQLFVDNLHIVPHMDGTVAVGSTSERDFLDGAATDETLDALIDKARNLVPALRTAEVVERWAGVRPRARSRAPMLGSWPEREGHFVANGGFKIGFGMAPKVAEVMCDLVLQGQDNVPDEFRVEASL